ncbi:MAG TPA: polyprenol monophosphomannose synthase [Gemmatimonadales bacterium]|nr:polyprenol monophosphomannose synthase [Gemmatimonadales bacterium]
MAERFLVVLPTYNESQNLSQIVPVILSQDDRLEVLIVDDNSPDGTGKIADVLAGGIARVNVLHRQSKEGLGRAYLAGFKWGLEHGFDGLFEMDADFSHDPRFLKDLITALEEGADLVLGSRYKDGVNVINWPMSRLVLSSGANLYARLITGLPLSDSTGGFKAFRRRVLEAIPLDRVRSNGYSFQIEMSYRAWKKGFRLVEVPIIFTDRVEGQSKMSKRIVREAIWMVWWLRFASIFGKL